MVMLQRLDDERAEDAIQWMVDMASGDMSDADLRRFEAWLAADDRNEAAWIRLQEGLMPCGVAARAGLTDRGLGKRLMERQASRRRFMGGMLALVGLGATGLSIADSVLPAGALSADHLTLNGQQKRVDLADGSTVTLAPRAAIAVRYEPERRVIRLLDGEIMMSVASRPQPFHLEAGSLLLSTDSGQFVLKKRAESLSVTGIKGRGFVQADEVEVIEPSRRVIFTAGRIERQTVDIDVAAAWTDGLLIARNQTLASIVDDLRPYFTGVIRLDDEIALVRATAVLPLRDPNASIDTLAASLGLKVRRFSNYWVSIAPGTA
jgi:transmembrane sensor